MGDRAIGRRGTGADGLIEVIRNSLILPGISTFWPGAFVGSIIILAVAFDRIRAYRDSEG